MIAKDLMTKQMDMAKENTNVQEICAKLFAGEFNGLPVIDNDDFVIGIIAAIDILKAIQKGKNLKALVAKEIMTPNPSVIKKDTPIDDIIDIIIKKEIVMVPVVEDNSNKILGLVTRLDVLTEKLKEGITP